MRYADLHTHTNHSDGTRSSREVIDVARAHGIEIVSISDHDNVAAYFESKVYADSRGVKLVPGVELSCAYHGHDIHILAYAFDPLDERVEARLRSFRATRAERGKRMVDRLHGLGFKIDHERVKEFAAGGSMGRPHVARALVEAGHVQSVSEAFDKLIGAGKPAYVEKERFQIPEAVSLIHAAGGVLSIAHPTLYPNHEHIVPEILDAGVDAIEVVHPDIDDASREMYSNLARFKGKFTTGGSDDHGTVKKAQTLGTIRIPESMIGPILDRL
ncbi:MAG TPA: PHP domain-containing protein [Thermoanaerobaculia bacterium]|nr:PHP domain-containing protein [Thermoanaerobaculia bacterium]